MALVFCDGFKSYAATADLTKKWAAANSPWTWSATGGPDGGPCVTCTAASSAFLYSFAGLLPNAGTRFGMGFYTKISAITNGGCGVIFTNSAASGVFIHRLNAAGALIGLTSGSGQVFTGLRNVCDNQWHWVEFDINSAASQACRFCVDGVMEFSGYGGGSLVGIVPDRFYFVSGSSSVVSIANVMVWDNSGSGMVASGFPFGARNISTLRPNADGTVQFTRSSGSSSFALIDEVNADTSDYVESSTSGQQDLYDYPALGYTPAQINAVMLNSHALNPLAGSANMQGVCKSSATTGVGATIAAPLVTPRVVQQPFDLDPNGNIPWTQPNFDAAQFGVKVA